jgi:hypothetical protein
MRHELRDHHSNRARWSPSSGASAALSSSSSASSDAGASNFACAAPGRRATPSAAGDAT